MSEPGTAQAGTDTRVDASRELGRPPVVRESTDGAEASVRRAAPTPVGAAVPAGRAVRLADAVGEPVAASAAGASADPPTEAPAATGPLRTGRHTHREVRVGRGSRRRFALRDLPVHGKLFAALAVPTAAFLALALLSAATWLSSAASYGRGVTAAKLGRQVVATVHELQIERDLAVGFISAGRGADPATSLTTRLDGEQRVVDTAVGALRGSLRSSRDDLGESGDRLVDGLQSRLDGLAALRRSVRAGGLPTDAIFNQYSGTIAALVALDARIGQGRDDVDLQYSVAVLNSLTTLKETESQIRGQLFATAFAHRFAFGDSDRFSGLLAQEQAAQDAFRATARVSDRARFDQVVNGQAVLTVRRIAQRAVQRQRLSDLDIDPEQWFAASTTYIELLRTVESTLLDNVTGSAEDLRSQAWERTGLIGAFILVITIGAVIWTLAIARTMTVPLRRLRTGALEAAQVRLPALIEELRSSDSEHVETVIRPIGIDSRDEIGEVARTVDHLQREAVRLATEQAGLRRNVNTLFLSLSRRSQSLIERQIALIDRLEAAEENPAQLENLFRLDHLATRMRRNSENLLVLAGTGPGRRRSGPVPLGDVLQAALGEIEQYERVQIVEVADVRLAADAVNHVVHLVAELLENAAQFSPPYLPVDLAATTLGDGAVLVAIDDSGLGMSDRELGLANQRLAQPPLFDFSIAQRLGLFVVARLADRHGIKVRLAHSHDGGVRATALLPAALLAPAPTPVTSPREITAGGLEPAYTDLPLPRMSAGPDPDADQTITRPVDLVAPPAADPVTTRAVPTGHPDLPVRTPLPVRTGVPAGAEPPVGTEPPVALASPPAPELPAIADAVAALRQRRVEALQETEAQETERTPAAAPAAPVAAVTSAPVATPAPAAAAASAATGRLADLVRTAAQEAIPVAFSAAPFDWFTRDEQDGEPAGQVAIATRVTYDAAAAAAERTVGAGGGGVPFGDDDVAGPEPRWAADLPVPGTPASTSPGGGGQAASTGSVSGWPSAEPGPAEPGPGAPRRVTSSGLPRRTPSAQPFPGDLPSAVPAARPGDGPVQNPFFGTVQLPSSSAQTPQAPAPDWIRGRLSRLYEGVQHARDGQQAGAEDSDAARPAAAGGDFSGAETGGVVFPPGSP